jgi:hypothetical protein
LANEELMAWRDANRVDYVFGLARSSRLEAAWAAELAATGQGTQTGNATLTVNLQRCKSTQGGPFSPSSFRYQLSATYGSVKYSIATPGWLARRVLAANLLSEKETDRDRIR